MMRPDISYRVFLPDGKRSGYNRQSGQADVDFISRMETLFNDGPAIHVRPVFGSQVTDNQFAIDQVQLTVSAAYPTVPNLDPSLRASTQHDRKIA